MIRAILLLTLLFATTTAHARRVAIVVANQTYLNVPVLANPLNDARAVAAAFGPQGLGFDQVEQISNADLRTLRRLPVRVRELARGADTVVVYLAGHGMRDDARRNYFLPVDADIKAATDIEAEGLEIEAIVAEVKAAAPRVGLIVVDACRNNPFNDRLGTRNTGRGLARRGSEGLEGLLIAYAADGGQVADDGRAGALSPFAAAFVKRVRQPGARVLEMLDEVSDDVRAATAGRQTPTRDGNLRVSAVLAPALAPPATLRPAEAPVRLASVDPAKVDLEREMWDLCKGANGPAPCRAYLNRYSGGTYAELAKLRLDGLVPPPAPTVAAAQDPALATARRAVAAISRKLWIEGGIGTLMSSFAQAGGTLAGLNLLASANDPAAMALLGLAQAYGAGGVGKDEAGAVRWLTAAANAGSGFAQYNLGWSYKNARLGLAENKAEAARLYKLAADQGEPYAQNGLATLYDTGAGGIPQNKAEAARLYKLAADYGVAGAQYNLATLYNKGTGVTQNKAEAARLYKLAADQGDTNAQVFLGYANEVGEGVAMNKAEAERLYRLAADKGDAQAQGNLAYFYENGIGGLAKDQALAIEWYRKAARQNNERAIKELKRLGVTP